MSVQYILPNGLPVSHAELETILVYVRAPSTIDTSRTIEISPSHDSDLEVLGFLSCNEPGEIRIQSLVMGGRTWEAVDPHVFHYVKNYPFHPLKEPGVRINKLAPMIIEFTAGEIHSGEQEGEVPSSLKLSVVGHRKLSAEGHRKKAEPEGW